MLHRGTVLIAATRQAALIALAIAGLAAFAAAQTTTYELRVSAAGIPFYNGTAQVTSVPAGIDCRSESAGPLGPTGTCKANFAAGTTVTLTATPLLGGTFDGWTDACAGQEATCHLEMTGPLTASPKVIAKTFTLTVRGTGNTSGEIFSIDGFAQPSLVCLIGPGGVTTGRCEAQYPAGQIVWLSSDAGLFQSATRYFGCGVEPFGDSCRFVIDGPRTVVAGWVAPEIIVYGGGDGAGTVVGIALGSNSQLLNCIITGTEVNGTCSVTFDRGVPPSSVSLTATPTGNSVFAGWSGRCSGTGPCIVSPTVLDSLKVSATFTVPSQTLSVTAAGSGNGSVASTPLGIACVITAGAPGPHCSAPFSTGTAVTLTADPSGGSTFGGWSGVCSGTELTCAVTIAAASHATVRFVAPRPAAELAQALLGSLTLSSAEQHELDRFGNQDGTFNLGDLLALLTRTGERLSGATMHALASPHGDIATGGARRIP